MQQEIPQWYISNHLCINEILNPPSGEDVDVAF